MRKNLNMKFFESWMGCCFPKWMQMWKLAIGTDCCSDILCLDKKDI